MTDHIIQTSLDGGDVENLFGQINNWRVSWYGQVWLVPLEMAKLPTETLMGSTDPTVLGADPILAVTWEYSCEAKTLADALQSGKISLKYESLRVNGIEAGFSTKAQDYLDTFNRNCTTIDWEIKKIIPCILPR